MLLKEGISEEHLFLHRSPQPIIRSTNSTGSVLSWKDCSINPNSSCRHIRSKNQQLDS
ncbi:hypothetical protein PO124_04225 [Bacillus licheniformis]|nr:hypothetical protein [Bacillus licheniformis]